MNKWELLRFAIKLKLVIAEDFDKKEHIEIYQDILDIMEHCDKEVSE